MKRQLQPRALTRALETLFVRPSRDEIARNAQALRRLVDAQRAHMKSTKPGRAQ